MTGFTSCSVPPRYSCCDVAPQSQSDWEVIDTISPRVKEEVLKAFTDEAMQKLEQKIKEGMVSDGKMTFWERIIAKVIDNIQVTIKYAPTV